MDVDVLPMADHEFAVTLTEGHITTNHRLVVPPELLDGLGPVEEERVVRESVAVFLEHEPSTSMPDDLTLDWLVETVPGFDEELRARLA